MPIDEGKNLRHSLSNHLKDGKYHYELKDLSFVKRDQNERQVNELNYQKLLQKNSNF